jgi:hypothetical protein
MSSRPRPTPEQDGAYRKAFKHFDARLFGGELPEVVLTFGRRDTSATEICMKPEHLVGTTPLEAAAALVHEMCHQWRLLHGEPPKRGYHDAGWAKKALAVGLIPTSTGQPGGKTTGFKVVTLVREGGPFAEACEGFPDLEQLPLEEGGPARADQSKVAYRCDCATVWGKRGLKLRCLGCKKNFVEAP